jgi:plastocyanin
MKAVFVGLVAALAASSFASDVQGKVTLANGRLASHCVVYLEGGAHSKPLKSAVIDQKDRRFIPHVTVITVGTNVAFPNDDTIFHNVFADYNAHRFTLGIYARGQVKHQVFPKPGVVALMCSIHPDMSAYIMVVDTPYYAEADSNGAFNISNVPDGDYTLKIWHESGQTASQPVHVAGHQILQFVTHRS